MTKDKKPFTHINPEWNKKIDDLIKFYAVDKIDYCEELRDVLMPDKKPIDQSVTNLNKSIVK